MDDADAKIYGSTYVLIPGYLYCSILTSLRLSTLDLGRRGPEAVRKGSRTGPEIGCQRSCTMMLLLPLALLLATAASASGANAPHLFMFIVDDLGCANACLSAGHRSSSSGRTVVTAAR